MGLQRPKNKWVTNLWEVDPEMVHDGDVFG
jgi:hypothetical protein